MNNNYTKYTIRHPFLTPELYQRTPHIFDTKIKALHISSNINVEPKIIENDSQKIIEEIFPAHKPKSLVFDAFYMYVHPIQNFYMMQENVVATHFFRIHCASFCGDFSTDTIYGDVCVFGTSRYEYQQSDTLEYSINRLYSVPYEIVEQISSIYDKV